MVDEGGEDDEMFSFINELTGKKSSIYGTGDNTSLHELKEELEGMDEEQLEDFYERYSIDIGHMSETLEIAKEKVQLQLDMEDEGFFRRKITAIKVSYLKYCLRLHCVVCGKRGPEHPDMKYQENCVFCSDEPPARSGQSSIFLLPLPLPDENIDVAFAICPKCLGNMSYLFSKSYFITILNRTLQPIVEANRSI